MRLWLSHSTCGDLAVKHRIILGARRKNFYRLQPVIESYLSVSRKRRFKISIQCNAGHRSAVSVPVITVPHAPSWIVGMLVAAIQRRLNQRMGARCSAVE